MRILAYRRAELNTEAGTCLAAKAVRQRKSRPVWEPPPCPSSAHASQVRARWHPSWYRAGWAILAGKESEVAGLKRTRLDLLHATVEISEQLIEADRGPLRFGPPKSKASRRTLSLPPFLVTELEHHLDTFARHPGLVFTTAAGTMLRRSNFGKRPWSRATKAAGLDPLRFHDLRHTRASILIANNEHPKVVQHHLGHSSIQVTLDRYGHLYPDVGNRVAAGLEDVHLAAQQDSVRHGLHAVLWNPGKMRADLLR